MISGNPLFAPRTASRRCRSDVFSMSCKERKSEGLRGRKCSREGRNARRLFSPEKSGICGERLTAASSGGDASPRRPSREVGGSAIPPCQISSQPISSRVSMSEVFVQQHFNKSQMRPRERDRTYPDSKTPPSVVKNKSLPGVKG